MGLSRAAFPPSLHLVRRRFPRRGPGVSHRGGVLEVPAAGSGSRWSRDSDPCRCYPEPYPEPAGAGRYTLSCVPARPAELRLLPASPGLSGVPLWPRRGRRRRPGLRRAGNPGVPARGPPSQVRVARRAGGEGKAGWAVRPLPLSLRIPLIRRLLAAPRFQGCWGRPAGILETVPSLSPFIKRPWAALKPRSQ